jgi:hypothetical protein
MTDTVTSQNVDLSSWDTCIKAFIQYVLIYCMEHLILLYSAALGTAKYWNTPSVNVVELRKAILE